jgi:tetratricopeptide (TPR) repeat protein
MPARLFQSSGDLMADRRYEFARDLQLKGDLAAAADLLLQAIELAPKFASAWFTLGQIRRQLGEREAAVAAFRNAHGADPVDRHGASLHLMRLGAEEIAAMPSAYVQTLFDQYAPRFEAALVGELGYRDQSCCSRRCCRCGQRPESPPSSGARSISAAAPGLLPRRLPGASIASSASISRRA